MCVLALCRKRALARARGRAERDGEAAPPPMPPARADGLISGRPPHAHDIETRSHNTLTSTHTTHSQRYASEDSDHRDKERPESRREGGAGAQGALLDIDMSSSLLLDSERPEETSPGAEEDGATSSSSQQQRAAGASGATAKGATAAARGGAAPPSSALIVTAKPWHLAFDGSVPPSTNALATAKSRYSLDPPGFDATISSKEQVSERRAS